METREQLFSALATSFRLNLAAAFMDESFARELRHLVATHPDLAVQSRFRFLLDPDFHPVPAVRRRILVELASLPNSVVRIARVSDRYHGKVYLFQHGDRLQAIVGSANPTHAGLGRIGEACVFVDADRDPSLYREIRRHFKGFWREGVDYTEVLSANTPAFASHDWVLMAEQPDVAFRVEDEGVWDPLRSDFQYDLLRLGTPYDVVRGVYEARLSSFIRPPHEEIPGEVLTLGFEWLNALASHQTIHETRALHPGLPHAARTDLYPHQFLPLMALRKKGQRGLLIADEVGLGKTVSAGIVIAETASRGAGEQVLIVCPPTLTEKWKEELWRRFDMDFRVLDRERFSAALGPDEARQPLRAIVSYNTAGYLAGESSRLSATARRWDLVVFDEVHWVRNRDALRSVAARKISGRSALNIGLSATPVNLTPADLFNILSVITPHVVGRMSWTEYQETIAEAHHLNSVLVAIHNADYDTLPARLRDAATETFDTSPQRRSMLLKWSAEVEGAQHALPPNRLQQLREDVRGVLPLSGYISRTRRADVQEHFPERRVRHVEVRLSEAERFALDVASESLREIYQAASASGGAFGPIYNLRRQLVSSVPATLLNCEPGPLLRVREALLLKAEQGGWSVDEDSKLRALSRFLARYWRLQPDGKVVVFCAFRATARYLQESLESAHEGVTVGRMDGDSHRHVQDRMHEIRRFARNSTYRVLVCTDVASEGIDLQFCSCVINYDLPWNPMRVEQRIGRIDRIGQKASVLHIVNFHVRHSIDDSIVTRLLQRLKYFSSSLGPFARILSPDEEIQHPEAGEIEANFFSQRRSPSEQALYEHERALQMEEQVQRAEALAAEKEAFLGVTERIAVPLAPDQEVGRQVLDVVRFFLRTAYGIDLLQESEGLYLLDIGDDHPFLTGLIQHCADSGLSLRHATDLLLARPGVRSEDLRPLTFESTLARSDLIPIFIHPMHPVFELASAWLIEPIRRQGALHLLGSPVDAQFLLAERELQVRDLGRLLREVFLVSESGRCTKVIGALGEGMSNIERPSTAIDSLSPERQLDLLKSLPPVSQRLIGLLSDTSNLWTMRDELARGIEALESQLQATRGPALRQALAESLERQRKRLADFPAVVASPELSQSVHLRNLLELKTEQ